MAIGGDKSLAGQVAAVTAAGRGIGAAIAEALAQSGATVCCTARNIGEIEAVARSVVANGGSAFAIRADVTDADSVGALYAAVAARAGGIDLLFANASVRLDQAPVEYIDPTAFAATIGANLIGPYDCARLAIPYLRARGGGRMVMTGSAMGHSSSHGHVGCSCSKAGLWMLARILADELRAFGIPVNELVPGPVQAARRGVPPRAGSVVGNPVEWLKQPEDFVPMAMFLATHPAPGPTGQSVSLIGRTFRY